MTDEQTKQNAEEYYDKLGSITIEVEGEPNSIVEAYIAGAYSRDEEVKELNGQVTLHKDRADYYHDLYMKFRNPWISVEERLPDIGQKVITITNKGKLLLVARTTQPPHREEGGWRWEHYVGKVTHWMPIPPLIIED